MDSLGSPNKGLKEASREARKEYDNALSRYHKLLNMYASGVVKGLRVYAILLKLEGSGAAFWIMLGIGITLLLISPIDYLHFGIVISAIGVAGLILWYPAAKRAKAAIARVDPEILTLTNEIKRAKEKIQEIERQRGTSLSGIVYNFKSKKDSDE